MKPTLPTLILTLLTSITLQAQDAKPKPETADPFLKDKGKPALPGDKPSATMSNILLIFERFAVKQEDYLSLIDEQLDDEARYTRINEWTKGGKARLEHLSAMPAKSGLRTTVESIHELRFATEFEPPHVDDRAYPTGWETKHLGETEEQEFVVNPDNTGGDLNVVVQNVRFLGYRDCIAQPNDPRSGILQPDFRVRKVSTSRAVRFDKPSLIGTLPGMEGPDGGESADLHLCYVRVRQMPVTLPAAPSKPTLLKPSLGLRAEYTFFVLDRMAARSLLVDYQGDEKIYAALRELQKSKQATLDSTMTLMTKSGLRAVGESTALIRYGTEVEPPVPFSESKIEIASKFQTSAPVFTAFQTRDTGTTIEIEAVLGPNDDYVDVNHVPQFVVSVPEEKPVGAAAQYPYPSVPHFEVSKMRTSLTCGLDQSTFIGTFNLPTKAGLKDGADSGKVRVGFLRFHNEQ